MERLDASPTNEELQGVKDVIASFLIGLKNYALYPENHDICQKCVANAARRLDDFLKSHNNLRLDVEKDRLVYKNEVVFQEPAGGESLATIFFRDGIQWLNFRYGFNIKELSDFFGILKKYRSWREDADGDLVTAFWEIGFPNLRYKAADVYWESEPLIDFSILKEGGTQNFVGTDSEEQEQNSLAVVINETVDDLWTLTAEESEKLREMILEEEKRDTLNDLLFIIFVLLKDKAKNENLESALEFLESELLQALENGDFRFAYNLIRGLRIIQHAIKGKIIWAREDLNQFFLKVSSPEVLNVISQDLESFDELDSEEIKLLGKFFLLLEPAAIMALGPKLTQASLYVQKQITQIISRLASRDIRPLEQLLESPDEFMVQKLISVLGKLSGERPVQILFKMLQHSSDGVRKQAVKQLKIQNEEAIEKLFGLVEDPNESIRGFVLETQNEEAIEKLFGLIEDPNESIRGLVLEKLGKVKSEVAENLLLDYLEKRRFTITNYQHLLDSYQALGRCGSYRSIPFLRKSLFNRCWFPDFGRSVHRRGATVALMALGTKEAKEILQKASSSFSPSVRLACQKVLEVS